jgi:hypothetical protein
MKVAELDATLIRRVALELIKANPDGVRTKDVAEEPRVAAAHRLLIKTDPGAYHTLVGKILAAFKRLVPADDAPGAAKNMLWRMVPAPSVVTSG